ncbi:MAG TPA: hypothetical protein V6C98_03680 [Thermosynechococcaceae cyanobacterium]
MRRSPSVKLVTMNNKGREFPVSFIQSCKPVGDDERSPCGVGVAVRSSTGKSGVRDETNLQTKSRWQKLVNG